MIKFKMLLTSAALTTAFLFTTPSSSSMPDADVYSLEAQFPNHFAGFSSASLLEAQTIRDASRSLMKPSKGLGDICIRLSNKLKGQPEFKDLAHEIATATAQSSDVTLFQYLYYVMKIAMMQKTGLLEEEYFLRGAGFPVPYNMITKIGFDAMDSFASFMAAVFMMDESDSDDDEDDITVNQHHHDDKEIVEKQYITKGPYASIFLPLVGEDNLGFFYLAWTYFQGIHPVSLPLDDNRCELHGISMSRYAKFCHDLAHHQDDEIDEDAERFINELIHKSIRFGRIHNISEIRKRCAFKNAVHPLSTFGMKVHNLYHESLLAILNLSLKELNPLLADKRADFEAYSVAAFLVAHEEKENISDTYSAGKLTEMLQSEVILEDDEEANEGDEDSQQDSPQLPGESNLFKTSFINGESPLSDEEIFNAVKVLPQTRFVGVIYSSSSPINANDIIDFQVLRNKFYIQVSIDMIDGLTYKFREDTNYVIHLNLKHDLTMLEAAAAVLKRDYSYDLPLIPQQADYSDDTAFEQALKACRKKLDLGFRHLKDFWLHTSVRLSEMKLSEDVPSIAEKFSMGFEAAKLELAKYYNPEDPQNFLNMFTEMARKSAEDQEVVIQNDNNADSDSQDE